uniref:SCAN box domain-containing protein n=1 Tax=Naja naja TaxID=35670 RepID=A0A8C6VKT7_NAJNA
RRKERAKIQQQVELHSVANWQQFRTYQFKEEEGPRKALNQLREFARRWLSLEMRTSQEVFECVVLEQFVNILPEEVQHWVLEHQPNNCNQALELAENYLLAHQTSVSRYPETRKRDNGFPKEEAPLEKISGYWLKSSQKDQLTRTTKCHPGERTESKWELPENIGQLQASDPSLRKVLSQLGSLLPGGKKVTQRNDILYVTDKCGSRLVVPMACRSLIMKISHTIP